MKKLVPLLLIVAACPAEVAEPPLDLTLGDAIEWVNRADTSTFWETTDVEIVDGVVYACTATKGLAILEVLDGNLSWTGSADLPNASNQYPRCSHLDADGDLVVVTSHLDEIQPTPWIAFIDASDPGSPVTVASRNVNLGLEEAALIDGAAYAAVHGDGLAKYVLDGSSIGEDGVLGGLGNTLSVAPVGDGVGVGTAEGQLHLVSTSLTLQSTIEIGSPVQSVADLGDGRAVLALGSQGLALVDLEAGEVTWRQSSRGTALRVQAMPDGEVLVANWQDLRVYSFSRSEPRLVAVDAVFQADEQPRHLAAGTDGSIIAAGEWEGVHLLNYTPGLGAPELTPDRTNVKVPADGDPQTAELVLENEGNFDLEIREIEISSGWTVSPESGTVPPSESLRLTLTHEGTTGVESGDLTIRSNDLDEDPATIPLFAGSNRVFVGDPAPDFSYTAINTGDLVRLSDQRGRVVLLSYFATF